MPRAQRRAQTVAAASHPFTNCPADGRADVGTARATTIATPAAPPRYLAVLFAPLPSPGWAGGADDTASCPSAAFARPVPTPVTSMPGSSPDQPAAGDSCPSHSSPSRQIARPSASRCRVLLARADGGSGQGEYGTGDPSPAQCRRLFRHPALVAQRIEHLTTDRLALLAVLTCENPRHDRPLCSQSDAQSSIFGLLSQNTGRSDPEPGSRALAQYDEQGADHRVGALRRD